MQHLGDIFDKMGDRGLQLLVNSGQVKKLYQIMGDGVIELLMAKPTISILLSAILERLDKCVREMGSVKPDTMALSLLHLKLLIG